MKKELSEEEKLEIYEKIKDRRRYTMLELQIVDEIECCRGLRGYQTEIILRDPHFVETILGLAGWQKGRKMEPCEIQSLYEGRGFQLHTAANNFFCEFSIINAMFDFRWIAQGKWHHGGYDFFFYTNTGYEKLDLILDKEEEYARAKAVAGESVLPVAEMGYHMGGTLWVSAEGKFVLTHDYTDKCNTANSALQILKNEWSFKNAERLFVAIR